MLSRITRLFAATPAARQTTPRPRLSVEPLEDRAVPASFTAATVVDLIADMNAANQTPEADTIALVAGRTYTLTAADNNTDGANGLPVVAAGEDLTILGNGATIERKTNGGTPAFRLLDIAAGATVAVHDLTLQGGLAAFAYGEPSQGGAIRNLGALALDGVTLRNNTALGADGVNPSFFFFRGGAPALGGAVYSSGSLTVTDSLIQSNKAIGGRGADAYGYDPGADGGAGLGGGVYVGGGTATFTGCTVTGNTAKGGSGGRGGGNSGPGYGGGLYLDPAAAVFLDAYTVDHLKTNKASTDGKDFYGTYSVI